MARFSSLLKAKTSFVIKRLSRSESRSLGYAHWPEQKTRSYTNPKAFDDYIAAVRKLGLVVSFDSPQVARISKPTASE